MRILIVEWNHKLAMIWADHLRRSGAIVEIVGNQIDAVNALNTQGFDALIVDVTVDDGSVLAITDLASYRYPNIAVIIVSPDDFFSNGNVFDLIPNARTCLQTTVPVDDLAAVVEHYGRG